MQLYSIMCDAIRASEIAARPLEPRTSVTVHVRGNDRTITITRARTDRPEIISERICGFDETL
jgi:hypothetical protein